MSSATAIAASASSLPAGAPSLAAASSTVASAASSSAAAAIEDALNPALPVGAAAGARWVFAGRPIWQAVGFADLFFDSMQGGVAGARGAKGSSLKAGAFTPVTELLQSTISGMVGNHGEWFLSLSQGEMAHISMLVSVFSELKTLSAPPRISTAAVEAAAAAQKKNPGSAAADAAALAAQQGSGGSGWINCRNEAVLYDACTVVIHRLSTMVVGGFMLIPGGWFHRAQTAEQLAALAAHEGAGSVVEGIDAAAIGPIDVTQILASTAGAAVSSAEAAQAAVHGVNTASRLTAPTGIGHNVLYCVQRLPAGFCFAVINTSEREGLQYHPYSLDASPHVHYRLSLAVDNIPGPRLLESAFWLTLLRMQAFPTSNSRASFLYETLLPYLADKPLTAIQAENMDDKRVGQWATSFQPAPSSGDASLLHTCVEAAHFILRRKGMDDARVSLTDALLQWQLVHMTYDDMASLTAISGSEARMFHLLCQRLASSVAAHVTKYQPEHMVPPSEVLTATGLSQPYANNNGMVSTPLLRGVQSFIEQVHSRMAALPRYTIMRNVLPQQLSASTGWQTTFQPLPLFGKLRCDESVESLAGPSSLPPIFRPIEFTLVPERARTLDDVSAALRHCDHICTLLHYQSATIKNTYMLRVAFITHLFTQVLPVPLAWSATHTHIQRGLGTSANRPTSEICSPFSVLPGVFCVSGTILSALIACGPVR